MPTWVAVALLACVGLGALVILVAVGYTAAERRQYGTARVLRRSGEGSDYTLSTPRGRVRVRFVLHDDRGRVFEVTSNLRGEGPVTEYLPHSEAIVMRHVLDRLATLDVAATTR